MMELPPVQLRLEHLALFAAAAFLTVVTIAVWFSLRRTRARLRLLEERERDSHGLASPMRRLEQELGFVADFMKEFPQLLYELQSLKELRRIPTVLLNAMIRFFRAEQAVVLVRRRATLSEPERSDRLVVAALASAERGLKVGSEVIFGEGQLGLVADVQRVMERQDFEPQSAIGVAGLNHRDELVFDVVAPMVVADQTIGVIAFSRPARKDPRQKEMLQMIAQLGAVTWHNLSAYRNVKHAAEIDELTGIFNKAALKLRLSELVYEARQKGSLVSVFMFDIDHFKNYNDVNGHLAGDKLLRVLSQVVRDTVRTDDVFGRFGGEEFLLVMPDRSQAQAMHAAEKVRQRIAAHEFPFGDKQPLGRVSVSGGVASFPDDAGDSVELLQAADAALYRAKQEGRNRVLRAETGINPALVRGT